MRLIVPAFWIAATAMPWSLLAYFLGASPLQLAAVALSTGLVGLGACGMCHASATAAQHEPVSNEDQYS